MFMLISLLKKNNSLDVFSPKDHLRLFQISSLNIVFANRRFLLKVLMQLETTMLNQQEREGGECSYQEASHERPCETFQKTTGEGFP